MDRRLLKTKRPGSRVAAYAMLGISVLGCQQILGIKTRTEKSHVECVGEQCGCETGFLDCNASLNDGCEIEASTDQNNCGACGTVCANAACVSGKCACTSGFDDCDGHPENGCETDLSQTATSCGVCGHDCLGGTCAAGACQPFLIAPSVNFPGALTKQGDLFYFTDFDQIVRVPITGGTPESVVTIPNVNDLSVNDTTLVAMTSGDISLVDLSNAHITPLYSDPNLGLEEVLLFGDVLYATQQTSSGENETRTLMTVDKTTGQTTNVATDLDTIYDDALVPFGGILYWKTDNGTIDFLDASGPKPWPQSPSSDVEVFTLTSDTLFVATELSEQIVRTPLAGGASASIDLGGLTLVDHLAASGNAVYWSETDTMKLSAWEGEAMPRIVVPNADFAFPGRLFLDDKAIYWLGSMGIMKVAR